MSINFELLPDEPIFIQTLTEDYDYRTEAAPSMVKTIGILDQLKQPVFYIADMSLARFSLDDVIAAASMVTRQTNLFKHPNIIENIIVTQSRMIELSVKGMNSPVFGNVKVQVFATRDEALAYVRRAISLRNTG